MPARITVLALTGAALALALPAAASAGTLTVDKPCYVYVPPPLGHSESELINVAVTGGTPGDDLQVVAGDTGQFGTAFGTFDANGNGTAQLAPVFASSRSLDPLRGETIPLHAVDLVATGPVTIATGSAVITNLAIQVARRPSNPYRKRVIRVSGLTLLAGAGPLYASFAKGYNGRKLIKRIKLGTPNACGYLRVKKVLPPRRGPNTWSMYVHVGRSFRTSDPNLEYTFRVSRTFLSRG
jgi:hypothetical protein